MSLISSFYRDLKPKGRVRVKFLRMLISQLDRDSLTKEWTTPVDVDYATFIVENLLYLDYGAIEEVYMVIHTIDRIISSTGISLLHSIEKEDSSESIAILAQRSIVLSLLIGIKLHLKMAFNLTEAKCRAFDPKKAGSAKDNKPAARVKSIGIVEWTDIPYLEKQFENVGEMQEQLEAVNALFPVTNT